MVGSVWRGRDAVWDSCDPLPSLLLPHLQLPALLAASLLRGQAAQPWTILNFCLGQLR